ncbi:MAG: alpha/beta hydrolase [Acidimicrobiia bacterium]|nr:alpha/beta hydrolase [Acidimicrobiia bacterium]
MADFIVDSGGTPIAVFVHGSGPPLVMVHGSMTDHLAFEALVAATPSMTAYRLDRRGFGESGDGPAYTIEHEYGDVAAVVAEVARRTGEPVALFGHSYGANCALGGAVASEFVSHLVIFEPSLGLHYPAGAIESIEEALAQDDRDGALATVFSTVLDMTAEEIDKYRLSPTWSTRLRVAHTIPRECRVEEELTFESSHWKVDCPTLVMTGQETTEELATIARAAVAAIEGARLCVLEGVDHMAPRLAPHAVAEQITSFLGG